MSHSKTVTVSTDIRVGTASGSEVTGIKVGTLVGTLVYVFGAPGTAPAAPMAPQRRAEPYKFLDPYAIEDQAVFYGRDALIQQLHATICAHRTTALIGDAAMGKTSLIHAGLVPALAREGDTVAFSIRDYSRPAAGIRDALKQIPNLPVDLPAQAALSTVLSSFVAQSDMRVVIFFDQFERLFAHSLAEQDDLARQIVLAQDQAREDRLHFVFILREKFQALAIDLQTRIADTNLLSNVHLIPGLTPEEARRAITAPLHVPGELDLATLEEGLVDQWIVPQLVHYGSAGHGLIHPAPLQVVCSTLYTKAQAAAGPRTQPKISLALYNQLGQAEGILKTYLSDQKTVLGVSEDEWSDIRKLLNAMAGADTLEFYPLAELARTVGRPEGTVKRRLEQLAVQRLVQPRGDGAYALIGNFIINEIRAWFPEQYNQQSANEALERLVADWEDQQLLTERRRLQRIREARSFLKLTPKALVLLLRSAVAYEADPGFWLAEITRDAPTQQAIEKIESRDEGDPVTGEVAEVLLGTKEQGGFRTLAEAAVQSPIRNVRIAAALALSTLGGDRVMASLRPYLTASGPGASGRRRAAILALAQIELLGVSRDRPKPGLSLVPLAVILLRLHAHRVRIASIAASALAGTVLVGFVLALTHLIIVLSVRFPNPALQFISSLAVGVAIGGIVGSFYGVAEAIPPPNPATAQTCLRPIAIITGFGLANLFLIGASTARWPGWSPLLIGMLAGSGFAIANEWTLGRFAGDHRMRLLSGIAGLALTTGLATLLSIWAILALELRTRDFVLWQFAGGLNPIIFSGFPTHPAALVAFVLGNVVSGGIIGFGLAGGLAAGDWLAAELERARYV